VVSFAQTLSAPGGGCGVFLCYEQVVVEAGSARCDQPLRKRCTELLGKGAQEGAVERLVETVVPGAVVQFQAAAEGRVVIELALLS
jgi:hypothetical protein